MNGNIYKVASNVTKEEILDICESTSIDDYGDVFNYEDFKNVIDSYCLTDYDGCGSIILNNKKVSHSSVWIGQKTVYFAGKMFVPIDVLHTLFEDEFKIIWYNK